ncbi:unnamed protein product, partial [Bubo scandiacus]
AQSSKHIKKRLKDCWLQTAGTPHSFFRGARSHLEPGNFCSALRVTIHKDLTALNYSTHKEHFFSSNYKMLQ